MNKFFDNKFFEWFQVKYERIKHLKAWIPFIWKDHDWDFQYLLNVMEFKIRRMRKNFEQCEVHCGTHAKAIKQMIVASELLKRISQDDYTHEIYKNQSKCSCPNPSWKLEKYESDIPILRGASRLISLRCDYCDKHLKGWFKREDEKKKADAKYLFELLNKAHRKWWC